MDGRVGGVGCKSFYQGYFEEESTLLNGDGILLLSRQTDRKKGNVVKSNQ